MSRNFANPSSREVFESLFEHATSVHFERAKPVLGASISSLSQVQVATPQVSQAAAFQAAANLSQPKAIFPRPAKQAGKGHTPMEERNRLSTA